MTDFEGIASPKDTSANTRLPLNSAPAANHVGSHSNYEGDSESAEIDVLLATCNGARFLSRQLDSLFSQTFRDFRILARDDNSEDDTLQILRQYQERFPGRIVVISSRTRHGACRTFSLLAQDAKARYVAFCDQDDIWCSDKLEKSMRLLKYWEQRVGAEKPILIFTDLALIDDGSNEIAPSLWRFAHVCPEQASLATMLVQNLVTGCTALANRSLIEMGMPVPEDAVMHDYWFGLIAAAFGVLSPLYERTVLYRQHCNNAIGVGSGWSVQGIMSQLLGDSKLEQRFEESARQAQELLRRYESTLTPQQQNVIRAWLKAKQQPVLVRHWTLYRNGLRRTGLLNNIGFYLRA